MRKTNPISPPGDGRLGVRLCEQSQFATPDRQAGSRPEPSVRNKPNRPESIMQNKASLPAGPGGGGRTPIVRNKPNSEGCRAGTPNLRRANRAKRSQFLDCGLRIADWRQTCAGRPIVRNEPNSGWCRVGRGQGGVGGRANVRNKPNFSGRPWPRRAKCARRTQFPASQAPWNVRFEPNPRLRRAGRGRKGAGRGGKCAKRTQFPATPGGRGRGGGGRGAIVRNKANSEQVGRDTPPFHYSIIPPFQPDGNCAKRIFRHRGAYL